VLDARIGSLWHSHIESAKELEMDRPLETDFRIEGRKAIYVPTGWEIWLDDSSAVRPRRPRWSLNRSAEGWFEEEVKIMGATLLERAGF
jgi:hypothetical protein